MMIVANIVGGLGNQMFMYAAGRALALRYGVPLKLDLAPFATYSLRGYELDRLLIDVETASLQDLSLIADRGNIFREGQYFRFDPRLMSLPPPLYLRGYFQSPKYFADVEATIRSDFQFRDPPSALDARIIEAAGTGNTIALHIRRGDYIANPTTHAVHGTCSIEYYRLALSYIAERVSEPRIFVFSDDIYWAQQYFRLPLPTIYVGHNHGASSFQDMRLMSSCRHHIIANSSFSWWGAYLSTAADRIVVAPKRWMRDLPDISDLIPPGWIIVDA